MLPAVGGIAHHGVSPLDYERRDRQCDTGSSEPQRPNRRPERESKRSLRRTTPLAHHMYCSRGEALRDRSARGTMPAGEAMANVLATFAQFARRLIGQRTREALAAKRAQGVRLGRPRAVPQRVVSRIRRERKAGLTLAAIADGLNADAVPTAQDGRQWWPATVRTVLGRA
jgi:hypothetical protein